MWCEYSYIKSESVAQIRTSIAETQKLFYWRTMYMNRKTHVACNFDRLFETEGLFKVTFGQSLRCK